MVITRVVMITTMMLMLVEGGKIVSGILQNLSILSQVFEYLKRKALTSQTTK